MRFSLKFGKHFASGRLTPEQQAVIERLEREEITADEAERLLGASVYVFDLSIGPASGADDELPEVAAAASPETAEEEIARRLVERIAEEVDAETAG